MEKGKQIDMSSRHYGCISFDKTNNFSAYIDCSKLKILLCDPDAESCKEITKLLTNCSYQVISVRSAMEVIDALNSEGSYIDLILTAIDLPIETSMKMLKYIMQDKDFQHIPVIMMPTGDEFFLIHKFLKLGATDYLVKPLCKNEILNLWMHVRRQRGVRHGLPQKNIVNYGFGQLVSNEANMSNSLFLVTDNKLLQTTTHHTSVLSKNQ
ncbi:two-component response regulator-like APRR1 isoform X1 [Ziziphus jujuba]|uniref:Two-component response regulator-like APRR1 isoform X1 n=1 Tax=Ziziphus jujuba TaxID=326968 RepID=A0A6P3ZTS0_ZIZJJ|nr:two-component response regulator-like APRR1 isoform X1 [Ziziphus jujuba]